MILSFLEQQAVDIRPVDSGFGNQFGPDSSANGFFLFFSSSIYHIAASPPPQNAQFWPNKSFNLKKMTSSRLLTFHPALIYVVIFPLSA